MPSREGGEPEGERGWGPRGCWMPARSEVTMSFNLTPRVGFHPLEHRGINLPRQQEALLYRKAGINSYFM